MKSATESTEKNILNSGGWILYSFNFSALDKFMAYNLRRQTDRQTEINASYTVNNAVNAKGRTIFVVRPFALLTTG